MSTIWTANGETVQLATRIPKTLHRAIRVDAIETGATLTEWVSAALGEHLERCKGRKPAKPVAVAAK